MSELFFDVLGVTQEQDTVCLPDMDGFAQVHTRGDLCEVTYDPIDALGAAIDNSGFWEKRRQQDANSLRRANRNEFFARLKASRNAKTEIMRLLHLADDMAIVYAISDVVSDFDRATPAWMTNGECAKWGLRPMAPLYAHVERAFTLAERQVRH